MARKRSGTHHMNWPCFEFFNPQDGVFEPKIRCFMFHREVGFGGRGDDHDRAMIRALGL